MESGTPGVKSTEDGFLSRAAGLKKEPQASPLRAVALSPAMPRILSGAAGAVAMTNIGQFGIRGSANVSGNFESMYAEAVAGTLGGTAKESFEAARILKSADPQKLQPENGALYPNGPLGNSLRQIAQLIKSNVGLEVAFAGVSGWDTHAGEGGAQGQLANNLRNFSDAIAAFTRDLGSRMGDVVLVTMSEFGRTVRENGNRGTDHGHANVMIVLGVLHTRSLALNDGVYLVPMATNGPSSEVQVTGTVFLNCSIGASVTGSPILGQTFTIIDNDGTDPVAGTFHGAPEGSILHSNYLFKISYAGGDGNDVVLTTVGATATTLTQSSATTSFGDPFTVAASVTSDADTPPGEVIFYDGSETLAIVPVHNGTATWTTSDRGTGTHNITAIYQPSHFYFGSTSTVVTHQVQARATTTALGTSSASPRYGDAVTFTATVAPGPFTALAGGTVTFEADGAALGTVPVVNGSASIVTSALTAGVHPIVAKYSGDANFTPSASSGLGQTVAMARTEVNADLLPNAPTGGQIVARVVVRVPDHPSLTALGRVTVSENGGVIAEQLLAGGEATVALPGLAVGPHHLVVSFSGDSNFEPASTSVEATVILPRLSVSSMAIAEGNTGSQVVELLVQLSAPSAKTIRVAYTTIDGNARAGLDYGMSQGVLEFPPGEIARWIELHVLGDTIPEPDQSFAVVLSDPANADIGNGIGTVTILNDDGPVPDAPRGRPSRH
jgi:Uncharacterized protein conserved in bacteria